MDEGAREFGFIESLLDNMRDVKRFINSFKVVYNLIKDDCEILDLIVLELIRNKNIEVYNMIRSRELVKYSFDTFKYSLNVEKWKALYTSEGKTWPAAIVADLECALQYLFTEGKNKNYRAVLDPDNFYIYFSYQLFNQIPLTLFNETLQKPVPEILAQFDTWMQAKLEGDLVKATSTLETFPDAAMMGKMVIVFSSVKSKNAYWGNNATHLFFDNREFNLKRYFHNKQSEYGNFIKAFMSDDQVPYKIRGWLAEKFLHAHAVGQEGHLILSQREWQRIVYTLFSKFLDQNPVNFAEIWTFYNFNDYKRENHYIRRYPPAGCRLKRYLLNSPSALEAFTKKMIEPARNASRGYYMIYPEVIEEVFSRVPSFIELLEQTIFSEPAAEKARRAILTHIADYLKDRKAFPLDESNRPEKT